MNAKRMGGMGSLREFGTTPSAQPKETETVESAPIAEPVPSKKAVRKPKQERLVTVNIKILESQQDWLADTAKRIRQNNTTPVPAGDRVYPQHLIQVAIELLKSTGVNWQEVHNAEDLKEQLKL